MDVSTILKRIELRRIELGMSKTEFYEKSGISSATYSQWNTNTFQPSRRKLMAAASALKMTYEELVGEETTIGQKEIPPTEKVDGIEINPEYFTLSAEDRLFVNDMISKLAKSQSNDLPSSDSPV